MPRFKSKRTNYKRMSELGRSQRYVRRKQQMLLSTKATPPPLVVNDSHLSSNESSSSDYSSCDVESSSRPNSFVYEEKVSDQQPCKEKQDINKCKILCQANTHEKCLKKTYDRKESSSKSSKSDCIEGETEEFTSPRLCRSESGILQPSLKSPQSSAANKTKLLIPFPSNKEKSVLLMQVGDISRRITRLENLVSTVQETLNNMQKKNKTSNPKLLNLASPASTHEELDATLGSLTDDDIAALGRHITKDSLRSTVRGFIKSLMKKSVAETFSWSGLGHGRQHTKLAFRDHKIYTVLTSVLHGTRFKTSTHAEIGDATARVLSLVGDWEGGRAARTKVK